VITMTKIFNVTKVSSSGYYDWKDRPLSAREQRAQDIKKRVVEVHRISQGTYGAPRVRACLRNEGVLVNPKTIGVYMQKMGLQGCTNRKFKRPNTIEIEPGSLFAERIFKTEDPQTHPKEPGTVWGGDMSVVETEEGNEYLSVQLDLFTHKCVGFAMTETLTTDDAWKAVNDALVREKRILSKDAPPLVLHSDRGGQYSSHKYAKGLRELGITQSMSRTANCYDNAIVESFFHTLKAELVYQRKFKTRVEAREAIEHYIRNWYNPTRLHSSLGYMSPEEFERQFQKR